MPNAQFDNDIHQVYISSRGSIIKKNAGHLAMALIRLRDKSPRSSVEASLTTLE